jgi:hypothetical protein
MSLIDNRPASKEELIILQNEVEQLQLGEFPALNSLEDRVTVVEGQVVSISGELAQEILDRESADADLQATIEAVGDNVNNEIIDRINADDALDSRINVLEVFGYDQIVYVAKNGSDSNLGKQHSPFLTISEALNSITDASPSKRYAILVQAGSYAEASISLKANVYIVGEGQKENVAISGPVSLHSSFSGNADNRSGFARLILSSACDFNWATVTSAAGKLYFNEVSFSSTVNMYGHNNATAQAQFNDCLIFGNLTISGINVGVFSNNICFGNVTLNQHPNGGMASILNASGGYCAGTVRLNAAANNFGRRSASFLRAFNSENLIVDGPSAYADADLISQSKQGAQRLNGGNLIALNPSINHALNTEMIAPKNTNTHNMGDWGRQWFWNFGYVHASTGTDLFLISYPSNFAPDSEGKSIGIYTDGAGLQPNVNGGNIELGTAAVSGSGIRGKITLNGREIDVTSKKIVNVANGENATDAVNKGQLDAAIEAIPEVDLSPYYTKTEVDEIESDLQDQIDDLDTFTQAIQSDLDDVEALANANAGAIDDIEIELALKESIANVDSKDAATLASANEYTDSAIAAIPPVDFTGYATEQYVDDAIAAIPEVDLSQIESDIDDLETFTQAIQNDLDDVEALANANAGAIDDIEIELALKESIANVDSKDAATLASANEYTDSAIAAIPPVDFTGYATEQYVDDAIAAIPEVDLSQIESDIDDLEAFTQAIQSDLDDVEALANANAGSIDDLESRVGELEEIPVYEFHTMSVVVASETEQQYVDCAHLAVDASLSVHVDPMKAHIIRDFTTSVVDGKTRITWVNTFAIGGVEAVEIGETIYLSYNYEVQA